MAVSEWDKKNLTQDQQAAIQKATDYGYATGDWDTAHKQAEAIRAQAGYSGGTEGSSYIPMSGANKGGSAFNSAAGAVTDVMGAVKNEVEARARYKQTLEQAGANEKYDFSDYLRQQAAAQLQADLAKLKGAYEKSLAGYNDAADRLPQTYTAAKNEAAAQNALEKRAFDERAAASGVNSGASSQAELARSSVLQRELAGLSQQQANALSDLELQKAQLKAEYESAIAEANATGNATLANALYQELIRVQGLTRDDALIEAEREMAERELNLRYGLSSYSSSGAGGSSGNGYSGGGGGSGGTGSAGSGGETAGTAGSYADNAKNFVDATGRIAADKLGGGSSAAKNTSSGGSTRSEYDRIESEVRSARGKQERANVLLKYYDRLTEAQLNRIAKAAGLELENFM